MSNLSIPEITNDGKEYRTDLLLEKVFELNGNENNFMTDSGLFHATSIVIGGQEYKKPESGLNYKILALRGTRGIKLELNGKLMGSKSNTLIPINKVEKGEVFGGQPAGGKKVNKGIIFEEDLYKRFAECIRGEICKGKYATQAKAIMDATSARVDSPVGDVEWVGGKNSPRPLILEGSNPIIKPSKPAEHGKLLTDITLFHKNKKKSYLSLKYSSTLTFVNAGVQATHFPKNEIISGEITNNKGVSILTALGIDNESFCKVFNDYGKGKKMVVPHKVTVTDQVNKNMLKSFIQTAIGANYWMVHGMGSDIYFWEMSARKNPAMATISSGIEVLYGGSNGTGKRIDMTFSNSYFEFKLNIRNKQSGLYPSHLMMDYKSLAGTGKEKLPST